MRLELNRNPTLVDTTFGTLYVDGQLECSTLEDQIRADPHPETERNETKVYGETAIPPDLGEASATYELGLRDSPNFGSDTIEIKNVAGFGDILIHSGTDKNSTKGCVIVGDEVDLKKRTISGGKLRGVLAALKAKVVPALKRGERVTLTINNSPHAPAEQAEAAVRSAHGELTKT